MALNATTSENKDTENNLQTFCRVVTVDLAELAVLHDKEADAELLQSLLNTDFDSGLGLTLNSEQGRQGLELMRLALESLPDELGRKTLDGLASDYASIYLNYGIHASPEESVWTDEENLVCQQSMFQVRKWFERFGLAVDNWRKRPDDHLVLEVLFLSHLFGNDPEEVTLKEAARFMDEHLLRWLPDFANRVVQRCATPFYAAAALLTAAYCEELRDILAEILDEPRPSPEEIEERMRPAQQEEEVPLSYMPGVGPAV